VVDELQWSQGESVAWEVRLVFEGRQLGAKELGHLLIFLGEAW